MNSKQKIINQIINNLPKYNANETLNVKIVEGKPITLEHYTKILEPISKRYFKYFFNNLTCLKYDTEIYSNYYASEVIKRVLQNINNIKISQLNDCLFQLLNFKSEIVHYKGGK